MTYVVADNTTPPPLFRDRALIASYDDDMRFLQGWLVDNHKTQLPIDKKTRHVVFWTTHRLDQLAVDLDVPRDVWNSPMAWWLEIMLKAPGELETTWTTLGPNTRV